MADELDTRPPAWRYRHDAGVLVIRANTKSEARAKMKMILDLPRLPPGAEVEKVEPGGDDATQP